MGIQTLTASTNAVSIATPYGGVLAVYPFTVGGWICPLAAVTCNGWVVSNTGLTTNYYAVYIASTSKFTILGGSRTAASTNSATVGQWYYMIGRFISATNRRLTVLEPDIPAIEELQSTLSATASGWNTESIGANRASTPTWSTAIFAEWWRTDIDIQGGGAALQTDMLFQLAYKGPWSIPSVAERIVWYKSFRETVDDTVEQLSDLGFARNGRAGWASVGTPIIGPHPPLASDYVYLNSHKTSLLV